MKKFFIVLIGAILMCSFTACSNSDKSTSSTEAVSAKEVGVNVADIGTSTEAIVDDNGEVINDGWVPAAGRVGAYIDIFEDIDSDNARAILENAAVADEAGYDVYILLGTKSEDDGISYAYIGTVKNGSKATSAAEDTIVVVKVFNDGTTDVSVFEGTRDDIVGVVDSASESDSTEKESKAVSTKED